MRLGRCGDGRVRGVRAAGLRGRMSGRRADVHAADGPPAQRGDRAEDADRLNDHACVRAAPVGANDRVVFVVPVRAIAAGSLL